MKIDLSTLVTLPVLVEGKVCIINPNGTYDLVRIAPWCIIFDRFEPENYAVLKQDGYSQCITYSEIGQRLPPPVDPNPPKKPFPCRVGDFIHIKPRRGIYEVVRIRDGLIEITCKQWIREGGATHWITQDQFQCLAGGHHNATHY